MTDDKIVLRGAGARVQAFLAAGWLVLGLLGAPGRLWVVPVVLVFAAYHGALAYAATILTPECLVSRSWRGTRRVAWADVREITFERGAVACLRDGGTVPLPGVTGRAGVPAEYADPASAQAVTAYALRHGASLVTS